MDYFSADDIFNLSDSGSYDDYVPQFSSEERDSDYKTPKRKIMMYIITNTDINVESIELRFFTSGHPFVAYYQDFSCIDNGMEKKNYDVETLLKIIEDAKKKGNKLRVIRLKMTLTVSSHTCDSSVN